MYEKINFASRTRFESSTRAIYAFEIRCSVYSRSVSVEYERKAFQLLCLNRILSALTDAALVHCDNSGIQDRVLKHRSFFKTEIFLTWERVLQEAK